ncbi:MAG: Uma2 family endonuclease [Vulcanimicrobiota bacterium]
MADPLRKNRIVLTYDDYALLPNDRNRYEILEGDLIVTPSPTTNHQKVSRNLEFILFSHIKQSNCGELFDAPMDVILDESTVVQPDKIFILKEHLHILSKRGVDGAPDLLVEILSPATAKYDRISKKQLYARYGVRWFWIVDPDERKVEEYEREGESYNLITARSEKDSFTPGIFPELTIELSEVWA